MSVPAASNESNMNVVDAKFDETTNVDDVLKAANDQRSQHMNPEHGLTGQGKGDKAELDKQPVQSQLEQGAEK